MVLPLIAAGWAADQLFNDGGVTNAVTGAAGDFMGAGENKHQSQVAPNAAAQWGEGIGGPEGYAQIGIDQMGQSNSGASWAQQEMMRDRGPQAYENQFLSNNEATSRGYHQEGALNFAMQGMMGNQPSEAAYMLQGGLDKAIAGQQAMAGGARGGAGMALAQGNMGANAAALQNQAFNQAGQLRAGEISNYANMYGQLAGQQRQQDQGRLGMGNQMSQFNANQNDQYKFGMANAANQYGQQGQGWYQGAAHGFDQQAAGENAYYDREASNYNQHESREAGIDQANADNARANRDMILGMAGTAAGYGSSMAGAGGKASGGGGKK